MKVYWKLCYYLNIADLKKTQLGISLSSVRLEIFKKGLQAVVASEL